MHMPPTNNGLFLSDPPGQNTSPNMFSKLKWMPITDRIKYCKVIMVFKGINNLAPRYMSDIL